MRSTLFALLTAGVVALAPTAWAAESGAKLDIRKAVPADAFLAMHGRHNPERDYQQEYFKDAWQTFRDEKIVERTFKLVASKAPKEKLEKLEDAWDEVREALEPINAEALVKAQEVVVAEVLDGPVNQVIFVVRLTDEDAADYKKGVGQLFELVSKWSDGKVKSESSDVDDVEVSTLALPKESPIQPAAAQVGDLFLLSTSHGLVERAVKQLHDDSTTSKFDDPRLAEALKHLPEPEDMLVFFDGVQLFDGMRGIGDFIRNEIREKDDAEKEKGERVAAIFEKVVDECAILDYTVVVEYTEAGQNRTAELGKFSPGYGEKLLGKALTQGAPFKDWKTWVPADATAYSLSTGVNLHAVYEGVMDFVNEEIPEAKDGLEKFEEAQEKVGVHIDRDILQSFSGETVNIAYPGDSGKPQSIVALKCTNPERIGELIERGVNNLKELPAVEGQNIDLEDCDDVEGFKEIRAAIFQMVGARPVYGFEDGWMIMASSPDAAKKFLAVRSGEEDSIADADSFKKFDLEVEGDVYAASYTDIGAGVRAVADTIDQLSGMAPALVMMAAAEAKPEDLKLMNDAIGLLPSLAKVIRKFDFMEHRLSITRQGPLPDTYFREAVTLIRQPEADEDTETAG